MSWLGGWLGNWLGGWLGRIRSALSTDHDDIVASMVAILAIEPASWQAIFPSRVPAYRQGWPYLLVFSAGDVSKRELVNDPGFYDRISEIMVIGMLRMPGNNDTETIEDKMDALAAEVETRLTETAMRGYLDGFDRFWLASTNLSVVIDDSDRISHAEVALTYRVAYATLEGVPAEFI
jgi:hypothetical protein